MRRPADMVVYVGVFAYNEERIILKNLESILSQELSCVDDMRVFVVSSGSTDRTDDLVIEVVQRDARVILITQGNRLGKANAINEFLKMVPDNAICVMVSADVVLANRDCLCRMIAPFQDEEVGMTASHPVPIDDNSRLIGRIVNILWEMKHRVSLIYPKTGEMIAFRKVFNAMPEDVLVDEAYIEWEIERRGWKIVYVPDAIVNNKGPESIGEFIRQRKRIYIGHKLLERKLGYRGSTFNLPLLFRIVYEMASQRPADIWPLFVTVFLEAYSRLLGRIDLLLGRYDKTGRWDVIEGTKTF